MLAALRRLGMYVVLTCKSRISHAIRSKDVSEKTHRRLTPSLSLGSILSGRSVVKVLNKLLINSDMRDILLFSRRGPIILKLFGLFRLNVPHYVFLLAYRNWEIFQTQSFDWK